jgi:CubicO group peptidase (beta-lactamase class C family)
MRKTVALALLLLIQSTSLGLGCGSSGASSDDAGAHEGGRDDASFADGTRPDHAVSDAGPDVYDPTAQEKMEFSELLDFANTELTKSATPGVSLAVVLHGRLAFAAGLGKKNTASGAPVTTSTLFRAASMTKMITAATAMTLVEEGKLDLMSPITNYLPWFQLTGGANPSSITLNGLLSHSSGFPADTIGQCGPTTSGARPAFFMANPQPQWFSPGAAWVYSNTGFALAATVAEAAAGKGSAYEDLAEARILGPSGMTSATFDVDAAEKADHATGYYLETDGSVLDAFEPTDLDCPLLRPPGGLLATATDYAHFAEVLIANGGSVLKPSSVAAMESPHADMHTWASQDYGYALITDRWPYVAHASIWHDGQLPGFASMLFMVPDLEFAVVVFANSSGGPPSYDASEDIANQAVLLFLPAPTNDGITTTTPPSAWTGYTGTYDDHSGWLGTGIVVSIDAPDGGTPSLTVQAPNALSFDGTGAAAPLQGALEQAAVDTWVLPGGSGESVTFFPGADAGTSGYFATRVGVGIRP